MEISFADDELGRLDLGTKKNGLSSDVVRGFFLCVGAIRAAIHEDDLRRMKSLRFEKLPDNPQNRYSMQMNDQYRLLLEIQGADREKIVRIMGVEDTTAERRNASDN